MDDDLQSAVQKHQQGRLDEAACVYEQVIARHPRHAVALNLLGAVAQQKGDSHRALALIGQAAEIEPDNPSIISNLAEVHRALGNFSEAVRLGKRALQLDPGSALAFNNLGLAMQKLGDFNGAVECFERAIELLPGYALAYNNLGTIFHQVGRVEEALSQFQRALEYDPGLSLAHSNLGQLLLEKNQRSESLFHCREAVRLQPGLPEAHNNLGNALRERGRLKEAFDCYAEALRLNPRLALTCSNVAQTFQEEGQWDRAFEWYQKGLELDSESAHIHSHFGSLLKEQDQIESAIEHYEVALKLDPRFAEAHQGLGWVLHDLGRFDEALQHYRAAIEIRPDLSMAHNSLGMLFEEMGKLEEAEQAFQRAIASDSENAGARAALATLLRAKLPDEDRSISHKLAADPLMTDGKRAAILFGLAHVYDARKEYQIASDQLRLANMLALSHNTRRGQGYDPSHHERLVEGVVSSFTPDFFARMQHCGLSSRKPIFIVGLPRSGTTLTEQILASHSQVFGAGELGLAGKTFNALPQQFGRSVPAWEVVPLLDCSQIRQAAITYLDQLESLARNADRIVDKMPDNYLYLGLIAALFPQAKVIHCRRDLRDIAVSCWMTNFRQIRWANHFDHIASRFLAYQRLMKYWEQTLPISMMTVEYEETVTDLEKTSRRLVDWCGLDWEPACAQFHETKRPVRTASVTQVRQPVYRTSLERWRNYDVALGPLFEMISGQV